MIVTEYKEIETGAFFVKYGKICFQVIIRPCAGKYGLVRISDFNKAEVIQYKASDILTLTQFKNLLLQHGFYFSGNSQVFKLLRMFLLQQGREGK